MYRVKERQKRDKNLSPCGFINKYSKCLKEGMFWLSDDYWGNRSLPGRLCINATAVPPVGRSCFTSFSTAGRFIEFLPQHLNWAGEKGGQGSLQELTSFSNQKVCSGYELTYFKRNLPSQPHGNLKETRIQWQHGGWGRDGSFWVDVGGGRGGWREVKEEEETKICSCYSQSPRRKKSES